MDNETAYGIAEDCLDGRGYLYRTSALTEALSRCRLTRGWYDNYTQSIQHEISTREEN